MEQRFPFNRIFQNHFSQTSQLSNSSEVDKTNCLLPESEESVLCPHPTSLPKKPFRRGLKKKKERTRKNPPRPVTVRIRPARFMPTRGKFQLEMTVGNDSSETTTDTTVQTSTIPTTDTTVETSNTPTTVETSTTPTTDTNAETTTVLVAESSQDVFTPTSELERRVQARIDAENEVISSSNNFTQLFRKTQNVKLNYYSKRLKTLQTKNFERKKALDEGLLREKKLVETNKKKQAELFASLDEQCDLEVEIEAVRHSISQLKRQESFFVKNLLAYYEANN